MENIEKQPLEIKLRNTLNDISYKHGSDKPGSYIIFIDMLYKDVLHNKFLFQVGGENNENFPFITIQELNGDKVLIHFVHNKGIDNIDVFIKVD